MRRIGLWTLIMLVGLSMTACGSDYNWPDVLSVDAMNGGALVEALELSEVNEDAFASDLPTNVSFVIHFDETMDLASAEENIWVEDAYRNPLLVNITARLEDVTVTLAEGDLEPSQNHVLHIGDDVEDVAGWELVNGYDISFFTAP